MCHWFYVVCRLSNSSALFASSMSLCEFLDFIHLSPRSSSHSFITWFLRIAAAAASDCSSSIHLALFTVSSSRLLPLNSLHPTIQQWLSCSCCFSHSSIPQSVRLTISLVFTWGAMDLWAPAADGDETGSSRCCSPNVISWCSRSYRRTHISCVRSVLGKLRRKEIKGKEKPGTRSWSRSAKCS